MDSQKETQRLLKRLRLLIQSSESNQKSVEDRAGFSPGHLSQMLNGHVEIKMWHLLLILDAIDVYPADLFLQLFPRRPGRVFEVLKNFARGSRSFEKPLALELARLYGYGIESLEDLECRLEQCEGVLTEMEAWHESEKDRADDEDRRSGSRARLY